MKGMKSAGKSFRRALRKSDAIEALKYVQKAQESTLSAKKYIPAVVETLEGEEKAEMLKWYRMGIISTLEQWCLIEKALLEGDVETAGTLAKKISDLKKRGHETFRKDD
jgi:soluble cytochrome b562